MCIHFPSVQCINIVDDECFWFESWFSFSSVNFLIYCSVGEKFKKVVVRFLRTNILKNMASSGENLVNLKKVFHSKYIHETNLAGAESQSLQYLVCFRIRRWIERGWGWKDWGDRRCHRDHAQVANIQQTGWFRPKKCWKWQNPFKNRLTNENCTKNGTQTSGEEEGTLPVRSQTTILNESLMWILSFFMSGQKRTDISRCIVSIKAWMSGFIAMRSL